MLKRILAAAGAACILASFSMQIGASQVFGGAAAAVQAVSDSGDQSQGNGDIPPDDSEIPPEIDSGKPPELEKPLDTFNMRLFTVEFYDVDRTTLLSSVKVEEGTVLNNAVPSVKPPDGKEFAYWLDLSVGSRFDFRVN